MLPSTEEPPPKLHHSKCYIPKSFNLADIIEGHVKVLQVLEMMEVLHPRDDIILQVQDLDLLACHAQYLIMET